MQDIDTIVRTLRAVADPARLRLLRLCVEKPVSVSELAIMMADSEPNVSRQLKQLATAGLLRRVRRGQRVEYSPVESAPGIADALLSLLMIQVDPEEAALREARARLRGIEARQRGAASGAGRAGTEPLQKGRLGMTWVSAVHDALRADAAGQRVCLRVAQREIFDAISACAAEVVLRADGRREREVLQAWLQSEGLNALVLSASELRAAAQFGVVIEVVLGGEAGDERQLGGLLLRMRASLQPEGVAYCSIPYEWLETSSSPLAHWRRMLAERGFECLSLQPIEAEGQHLLLTRARVNKQ
jgi:ArsR family transcriptional regulator